MSTGNRNFRDLFSARSGLSVVDIERLNGWSVDLAEELRGPACEDASGFRIGASRSLAIHHNGCWHDGGFKRSSQHDLCRLIGETGQAPLRVSSNQASFGAAS